MFTTMAVPKENTLLKLSAFTAFNGLMGLSLAPLVTLGGPLVLRAAAYTGAIVGSLAYIAATAPSDDFLWMGGPLTIGLGIVLVSSVGTMIAAPGGAAFTAMNAVALYGGLALFSGFVLYDISKVSRVTIGSLFLCIYLSIHLSPSVPSSYVHLSPHSPVSLVLFLSLTHPHKFARSLLRRSRRAPSCCRTRTSTP